MTMEQRTLPPGNRLVEVYRGSKLIGTGALVPPFHGPSGVVLTMSTLILTEPLHYTGDYSFVHGGYRYPGLFCPFLRQNNGCKVDTEHQYLYQDIQFLEWSENDLVPENNPVAELAHLVNAIRRWQFWPGSQEIPPQFLKEYTRAQRLLVREGYKTEQAPFCWAGEYKKEGK